MKSQALIGTGTHSANKAPAALIAVAVMAAILLQLFAAPLASAAEAEQVTTDKEGNIIIKKSYYTSDNPPDFAHTYNSANTSYQLKSVSEPMADTSYQPPRRAFSRQISLEIPLHGIANLPAYFPSEVAIDEGEYQGMIAPDSIAPFVSQLVYESWSGQVDRTYTHTGLPDNDLIYVPTAMDFSVRSSDTLNATTTKTLSLVQCNYTVTGYDDLGFPNSYSALCVYRGEENWLDVHHYIVTANYSGELSSQIGRMQASAVYKPVMPDAPTPLTLPDAAAPGGFPLELVAAGAAAATVIILVPALLFYWFWFRRQARLVATPKPYFYGEGHLGTTIAKRRILVHKGLAEFKIPDTVQPFNSESNFAVVIKPSVARKNAMLEVVWNNRVIQCSELKEVVLLDQIQLLEHTVQSPEFNQALLTAAFE